MVNVLSCFPSVILLLQHPTCVCLFESYLRPMICVNLPMSELLLLLLAAQVLFETCCLRKLSEIRQGETRGNGENDYLLREKLRSNQPVLFWLLYQLFMAKPLSFALCFRFKLQMRAPFPSFSQQTVQKYALITLYIWIWDGRIWNERSPHDDRRWWHGIKSFAVGMRSFLLQNIPGS